MPFKAYHQSRVQQLSKMTLSSIHSTKAIKWRKKSVSFITHKYYGFLVLLQNSIARSKDWYFYNRRIYIFTAYALETDRKSDPMDVIFFNLWNRATRWKVTQDFHNMTLKILALLFSHKRHESASLPPVLSRSLN